jgi:hypothetical protein
VKKILLIVAVFWAGIAVAHIEQAFKSKSYGWNHYADTYSVSLDDSNILSVNRNGKLMFKTKNFCELNKEVIRP